jgi:hypothetical protein
LPGLFYRLPQSGHPRIFLSGIQENNVIPRQTIKVCGFTLKGAMARQEIAGMTFFYYAG